MTTLGEERLYRKECISDMSNFVNFKFDVVERVFVLRLPFNVYE